MEKKTVRKGGKSSLLVFLLVGMVLANIVLIYLILQNQKTALAEKDRLLQEQKDNYESDLKDLEAQLQNQIQKARRIQSDDRKLIDSLQTSLEEVTADREALRGTANINQAQLREYRQKIEAYQILLRKKDELITKIENEKKALYAQNTNLKEQKNELITEVTNIKDANKDLSTKVNRAAVLQAENVVVNILDNRGKLKSGGQYRGDRIDKLDVAFNFGKNDLSKIGNKDVYMKILEPAGTVLYNQDGSSGNFKLADGQNATYSARKQILFDNSRQTVRFQFARSGDYEPGRYTVEFYSEGYRIGYGSFQ
ncbi:MAG: hypothetical protein AAFU64_21030, partial [Bacteroidota bacterium]